MPSGRAQPGNTSDRKDDSGGADFELKLLLAGVGGQGVVFATRLLARAANSLGLPVLASETHGMSQRGGSVLAHLKIGGTPSPLIRRGTADVLLAFDRDEALRNLPFLRSGGAAFINTPDALPEQVEQALRSSTIEAHYLPAARMAMQLGSSTVTNVVLIGFAAAHPTFTIPLDSLQQALVQFGRELNLQALEIGVRAGSQAAMERQRADQGAPGA